MSEPAEKAYKGIRLDELLFVEVDWSHRAEHIRTRSRRNPSDLDIEPAWATEAVLDPLRMINTTGGESIEVIGLSRLAPPRAPDVPGRVLKIWLVPKDLPRGRWWGASACQGNKQDRKGYWEQRDE